MDYLIHLEKLIHNCENYNSIFNDLDPDNNPLTRQTCDLSDFHHPEKRDFSNIHPYLEPYTLEIPDVDKKEFLKYYNAGSKDKRIDDSDFNKSYYLELFLIAGIDNLFDFKIDQSEENKMLFFEWAYENKYSFDTKSIADDIFTYIKSNSHDTWNQKIEMINPEMIYRYLSGINGFFETLNQLDSLIRSEDRTPYDFSIKDMSNSIKKYLKQEIDTIVPQTTMYNLLKQKSMNRYSPLILEEFARLSTDHDLIIDKHKLLDVIEHYSKMYNARQLNGSLNPHKEAFQEIYETFGGSRDEELFPILHKCSKKVERSKENFFGNSKHKSQKQIRRRNRY